MSAMRQAAADRNPRVGHRTFVGSLRKQRRKDTKAASPAAPMTGHVKQLRLPTGVEMGFSIFVDGSGQADVTKVVKGGAADNAGVRVGSVLASVDGTNILGTAMSHADVLALIVKPPRGRNFRTFGFVSPSLDEGSSEWQVPAFKGEIGHLHVSQRQAVEGLTRPRRTFDIGDENPEANYCA